LCRVFDIPCWSENEAGLIQYSLLEIGKRTDESTAKCYRRLLKLQLASDRNDQPC
jgi:hypothetical protein